LVGVSISGIPGAPAGSGNGLFQMYEDFLKKMTNKVFKSKGQYKSFLTRSESSKPAVFADILYATLYSLFEIEPIEGIVQGFFLSLI
jgi:hypothetical protein